MMFLPGAAGPEQIRSVGQVPPVLTKHREQMIVSALTEDHTGGMPFSAFDRFFNYPLVPNGLKELSGHPRTFGPDAVL
jgi:hypothetical protein